MNLVVDILGHLCANLHTKNQGVGEEGSETHQQTAKAASYISELDLFLVRQISST